jgi:hypothetical protein
MVGGGGAAVYYSSDDDQMCLRIRVITKLPNSEQSYKGKV